ncbi:hypothetical protein GGS20DRAFT_564015 [Poronia punctata]|nr:hypothetical protein GGS20DRAFT_564015 [Poronia punctata]
MLSGARMAFSFTWVLAVCYFRFLSIRCAWLSGAFLFVGGGDPVQSSVAHVMITDITTPFERAQIFLWLHATDVIAGFFGPAISAALMESGRVWTVLLLSAATSFFGAFLIASLTPETLHLKQSATPSNAPLTQEGGSADSTKPTRPYTRLFASLRVLVRNPQALLMLCIFALQTAARELFNSLGLQYSNVKFNLSYPRGSVLLSLFQGAQGLMALVVLPLLTRILTVRLGWAPWPRDRLYAIVSIAATTSGLLVLASAPILSIEVIGLLLISIGSCSLLHQWFTHEPNGQYYSINLFGRYLQRGAYSQHYRAKRDRARFQRLICGRTRSGIYVVRSTVCCYGRPDAVRVCSKLVHQKTATGRADGRSVSVM